jgi:signal recognition particle subunit SRP54
MFESLSGKLEEVFRKLTGRGRLTDSDLDEATETIRRALLEADVNITVADSFCATIRERSRGQEVVKGLNPGQTVVKLVHEELIKLLGEKTEPLNLKAAPPVVIMLVGLQGSGKTTTCGKLARLLRDDLKRSPLLVPADVYRPAAIDQLKIVGAELGIPVFDSTPADKPVEIATRAEKLAKNKGYDTIIVDTAGRLQIDRPLMEELSAMVDAIEPHEILLVVDAMTGQQAVNVAKGFHDQLDIDGVILTKLDGDARGGAALSVRSVTGRPIKLVGMGEKLDALEVFHPDRMASRILGMGDMLSLIEKATKAVSEEDAKKLQKKIKGNNFTLEDFRAQFKMIKSMGSIGSLMKMVPGMGKLPQGVQEEDMERSFRHMEAIISSMTPAER